MGLIYRMQNTIDASYFLQMIPDYIPINPSVMKNDFTMAEFTYGGVTYYYSTFPYWVVKIKNLTTKKVKIITPGLPHGGNSLSKRGIVINQNAGLVWYGSMNPSLTPTNNYEVVFDQDFPPLGQFQLTVYESETPADITMSDIVRRNNDTTVFMFPNDTDSATYNAEEVHYKQYGDASDTNAVYSTITA